MAKIKIGILGTGGMANAHAGNFNDIRGVELFACYDVLPERATAFAERHNVKHAMTSVEDVIDGCDAIAIVTPDRFHAELSLKTLKAGKHLLCEKPLTTTLADAKKVARAAQKAAEKHGTIHMVNFSYRNSAALQKAIQIAAQGKLGEVRHVWGKYLQAWLSTPMWGDWKNDGWIWRLQRPTASPASGGTLADIGCHILDFATSVAGDAKALRCSLRTFPKIDRKTGKTHTAHKGKKLDANDSVAIELDLNDGGLGVLHSTRWATGHPNQVALGVFGTEGAVEIDLETGWHTLRSSLGSKARKSEWDTKELKPTPTNYQRFIKSIKTGVNDQADILRGAQVQAYLDACERSAENGGQRTTVRKWL